jgi:hypothetical protein
MDCVQSLFWDAFKDFGVKPLSEIYTKTGNDDVVIRGGKYMSKKILGYVAKKLHYKYECDYIVDNTRVSVCFWAINKQFAFKDIIKLLNFYIVVLNKIVHKPTIQLNIYLTSLKKVLPRHEDMLITEDNVNSGFTVFERDEELITIYRKEEIQKVLLHELIHYYCLDFKMYDPSHDTYFIDTYGIEVKKPCKNKNNPLALYESYVDTLACYGHIIANVLFKNEEAYRKGGYSQKAFIADVSRLTTKETKFYIQQAGKIYKYGHLKEDTHCFSYYICKCMLFMVFPHFLDLVKVQGIAVNTVAKQEAYLSFLRSVVAKKDHWREIKRARTKSLLLSSVRMTKLDW